MTKSRFIACCALLLLAVSSAMGQVSYSWKTLAGTVGGPGGADGTGSLARFDNPSGVAVDASGIVFVADRNNHTIRRVGADGAVTTLAGRQGSPGSTDATGSDARFNNPCGLAIDATGNLYVADQGNHTIRKITPAGEVTTLAGSPGLAGNLNAAGSAARFNSPMGVAVDAQGNVFVADTANNAIRKITPDGVVSTVSTGGSLPLIAPTGVAVNSDGILFVADSGNRRVTRGVGFMFSYATLSPVPLRTPLGVALDASGNLYVADTGTVRMISPDGFLSTVGGQAALRGNEEGVGPAARFDLPSAVAVSPTGLIYVAGGTNDNVVVGMPGAPAAGPSVTNVTIASNNANPAWAKAGNLVTVSLTTDETGVFNLGGHTGGISGPGPHPFAFPVDPLNTPQGPFSFSITAQNLAGYTTMVTATTDGSSVTVDTRAPVVTRPAQITAEATGSDGAFVIFPTAVATDASSPLQLTYSPASGSLFPFGDTKVIVSATDPAGNVGRINFTVTVRDTTPPVFSGPFSPLILFVGDPMPDYLAQATISDASVVSFLTQTPAAGTPVTAGTTQITLSAKDAAGHQGVFHLPVQVRLLSERNTLQLSSRPGTLLANTGYPWSPPTDARFVSYGDPAIDDTGTVVYTTNWSSVKAGRGSTAFVARLITTGTTVIPGALSFGAVGDPVIDGGHTAMLGTLRRAGAPTVPVIFDVPSNGVLSYTIRGFGAAPDAGGATFKTFSQIGVADSSLAFLGQLNLNTGVPKTTADSDFGVWARDATHALKLLLREGQDVGGKKIKTLVAFHPGNGSPGQGRGWLLNVNGVTQVHALALFTDKTEALLRADNEGHVTVLSSTGPLGAGKPTLNGASFASYSYPALNALGDHAFLGTLTAGAGGVKAANSRGIFFNDPATGSYDPIVRAGDQAAGAIGVITLAAGARFSTLYDPVLADNGGLIFRSLLTGVLATYNDSLWWQPAGGPLRLLAQEGQHPAGSMKAGEKWVSFASYAIDPAGRPIYTATVTGGGIGVWAMDYTGKLRQLFRTGDVIGGHQLTAFAILRALPGTAGMTRSFNGAQQIVWRAAFKDGTGGIVETVVP